MGNPAPSSSPDSWYAAFDILRGTRPTHVADLAAQFPEFENEVLGRRVFGTAEAGRAARRADLARAAIDDILAALIASLDEVLRKVRHRASWLARLRLIAGLLALLGSAGVLSAFSDNAHQLRLISALVGFAGAAGGLLMAFVEDQTGGEGSTARLRETMFEYVGVLAETRGRVRDPRFTGADDLVAPMMDRLTQIAAEVQKARSKLGLPLQGV